MIKISYEEMLEKICEKSGLQKPDVEAKIDAKLKQLSGLISKEGAGHIVANELGVALFEKASGRIKIGELRPGMRNIEAVGKIMDIYGIREFTKDGRVGKVGSLFIADETGKIRVVCWGDQAGKLNSMKQGDIVSFKGGYVKENNNFREIHINDRSSVVINPEGETIGEVAAGPQAERKRIKDLSENDSPVEVLGHIVQAFDPRYYEICPQCGKRTKPVDGVFSCPEHGNVEPAYAYVANAVIDDGSDNIRVVFFRDQADQLFGRSGEEMQSYRDSPETFIDIKNSVLGNLVKIKGRVVRNDFFDRMEIIAQSVDTDPDPGEELERLTSA